MFLSKAKELLNRNIRKVYNADFIGKNAQAGDILFVGVARDSQNPVSIFIGNGITAFTGGWANHAGLIARSRTCLTVIEATDKGVIERPLEHYLEPTDGDSFKLGLRRFEGATSSQSEGMVSYARSKVGSQYDYLALANFAAFIETYNLGIGPLARLLGVDSKVAYQKARELFARDTPSLFICSELVHSAGRSQGLIACDFAKSYKDDSLVSPMDLWNSKKLAFV